ncbi:MAG: hypothetical protein MSIBF_01560 [Candidatus Altiarchaeales archaeon IMC4]|nr:MAG: hypothetical protein MSIBF_01560 [Candidatus Altiarchaeales archaeon IMC4]
MALTVRYKKGPKRVYRPYIEVVLCNEDKSKKVACLLDSGADTSFIPRAFAEYLNLNLSAEPEESKGVMGTFETVLSHMTIIVPKARPRIILPVVPVRVPVEDKFDPMFLIGRNGFFDKFEITFREHKREVKLKIVPKRAY